MRFIVEGRRFKKHLHAITFARHLAKTQDRAVDVKADISTTVEKVERKWLATMHPPGVKRTLSTPLVIPQKEKSAV